MSVFESVAGLPATPSVMRIHRALSTLQLNDQGVNADQSKNCSLLLGKNETVREL
jgi:hypothetical protein